MSSYSPEYIGQVMDFISGEVVTADEFNTILNKIIHQGDNNSAWLNYLDTVGIPAAVAEITLGDIQEFIEEQVEEEIEALTVGAASRTTGWVTRPNVVFINTSNIIPDLTGYNNIVLNNYQITNLNTSPATLVSNPVFKGYSGTLPTSMTSEARTAEYESFRTALQSYGYAGLPVVYYSSAEGAVANNIITNNVAAYLYNNNDLYSWNDVAESFVTTPNQFPVIKVDTFAELTELLTSDMTIDTFCIVASNCFGTLTSANLNSLNSLLATKGFTSSTLEDYLEIFYDSYTVGKFLYTLPLKYGKKFNYNNVATDNWVIGFKATDNILDLTDLLYKSSDELHFTQNSNDLSVTKGSSNIPVITYTPTIPVTDDTLVGIEALTPTTSVPVVVATAGTTGQSGTSKTCSKLNVNAAGASCDGVFTATSFKTSADKVIPHVVSYSSDTGTLVLGGF